MPYSPPFGTVDLNLAGSYTPPVGTANLDLAPPGDERSLTIGGRTAGARAAVRIGSPTRGWIGARTAGARASATVAYDPNLLSAVHAVTGEVWQPGTRLDHSAVQPYQEALRLTGEGLSRWQAADPQPAATISVWQPSAPVRGFGIETWQDAEAVKNTVVTLWQQAPRQDQQTREVWQDGLPMRNSTTDGWIGLPLCPLANREPWQDGNRLDQTHPERFRDGHRLEAVEIEVWQQAGYPDHANPSQAEIPAPIPTPWGTHLRIFCPLPGTALRIGRVPCILIAEREVAVRRSYMSVNSASLVRWPDLTPLPVTAMTMETDFDSWCWGFSATLAGPDAWGLVQPNPLACEVLATVNGQQWKFLLDVPSTNRAFNRDQVTLKGRSRSAWLHDPYTPARDFSESNAREMQQLGESALENTGWTLAWLGENWVVPAGRYTSWNTPIGVLIRLANTTDDGIYTDPNLQVITLQKRWPVASWLIDGEVADLLIPEAAIISLSQSPVYTLPLNGVYVSGESHGALALVKIAGTDGAIQPADPIVHELLCDTAGVAARQRGLNALSDSGAGFTMDAETLFYPPTFPLVPPGQIVSIAGLKGVSRSVKISAQWSSGLQVKQSIGLERREVES